MDFCAMREAINNQYEHLSFLGGSEDPVRIAILLELLEEGEEGLARRELIDRFTKPGNKDDAQKDQWDWTVTKDTVDRAIGLKDKKGLLQRGLIEETSESESAEKQYQITWLGEQTFQNLWTTVRLLDLHHNENLSPFTSKAKSSEIDVTKDILFEIFDAEVHRASAKLGDLWQKSIDFSEPSETIIGMSQYVRADFLELYERYLTEEDRDVKLIITPNIRDHLHSDDFANIWSKCVVSGNPELYIYDEEITFNWTILDHGIAWGIFEEGAHILELLSESDELREWALQVFHLHKERSKDITDEEAEWAENYLKG